MKKSLDSICTREPLLTEFLMSDEDWKVALDYLRILKPFKQATLDLCGQKKIESGKLYLVVHLIDAHIKDVKKKLQK